MRIPHDAQRARSAIHGRAEYCAAPESACCIRGIAERGFHRLYGASFVSTAGARSMGRRPQLGALRAHSRSSIFGRR
jgi:hypothetical protein